MAVKYLGVEKLKINQVESNPLSANREDGATFQRLREEMKKHGALEPPVVLKQKKHYRVIAGHHRTEAWSQLGHDDMDFVILEGTLSQEEEFNLVNNLNSVRGALSISRVKRIIRKQELDVTELDVFKYPVSRLMPKPKAAASQSQMMRRARVRDMALKIAPKIAEVLLDKMDDAIICFRYEDKAVAVIRCELPPKQARANITRLKTRIRKALKEWVTA